MSIPQPPTDRTTNWHDYKTAQARRGSLSNWFDPRTQWSAEPTGKRGRQPVVTDAAILVFLTLKAHFGLALRQTTGKVASVLDLAGLDWPVLEFSTLYRRQMTLTVHIPRRPSTGHLRNSRRLGRAIWKRWIGYHRRSLVVAKMRCSKLLGERVMSRDFDRQVAELQIRAAILNRFTALGTPLTQPAG